MMEKFKKALNAHGLKATRQRMAVHKAMLELAHATAAMVSRHISGTGEVKVTVASVYNILSQLASIGIYKRRTSANNKMYFDVNNKRHIHLYDSFNNSYRDVFDDELFKAVDEKLRKKRFKGYKIDAVDIQIICHPSHRKAPQSF